MPRRNFNDLQAFLTVAREGNFTRSANALGITQSALSQAIKSLEEHLEIRLFTRTTRSVSLTEAGERLFAAIGGRFDEIDAELNALTALRDKPAGLVRITTGDHAMRAVLLPKLMPLMHQYPDVQIEFDVSYGLRDIVADRFDAGVRLGESIEKDMIAVSLGPPLRMAVVASPAYFKAHPKPNVPGDLVKHRCINLRLPTYGGLMPWDFAKNGRQVNVRVEGQATFNTSPHIVDAALDGLGIAFLLEDELAPHIRSGKLVRVLEDWCSPFPGYYLFYPSRRHPSPAFSLVLEALRVQA
ncbi:MAG: HTH-type transcriptional regulator PgrR [Burkholderia lata]|uniref:HTH-type transcriptional regulator PgrR n=1 Tax=Burkholderia lata (strain ATCC 17760 / DSM 23089 / LMG 22485 / NCIMB 9086 / R18194 / 383) TaxID=482957 RepID=A0A833PQZ7_BURL3|nr:LysR family transcriptional regulator [Burkholderia lata]KAF1035262.1 MAG: HTH-type transcriptional regulator PgrR [Burkholderia lata]